MWGFWRRTLITISAVLFFYSLSWAGNWEKKGEYYYLSKDSRDNFSLPGAGPNIFPAKYLKYDGVDFLARGAGEWQDYGRLDLEYNHAFSLPIRAGIRVAQLHLLIGGNYSNSYEHDSMMRLYGDKYFYSTLTAVFIYEDGRYREISVPVFWDWFHLGPGSWSGDGAEIRSLGENPVRKDCSIFHVIFNNPRPLDPVKNILITDSWLGDRPFSDIFALTLKSADDMDALPKTEK